MAFGPNLNFFNANFGLPAASAATRVAGRQSQPEPFLPEDQQESWARMLARQTGSMIEGLGYVLDTPGALARGVLAGDPLSVFGNSDRRVSGAELNQAYGLTAEDTNPWLKTGLGLATEIATDPLAWVSGPLTALTKAGKASKAAGLLDLAPRAAQTAMGRTAARKTLTGAYTDDAIEALLPKAGVSAGGVSRDLYSKVRPLLGPRLARTKVTLEDVVNAADDPADALNRVLKYLSTTGDSYDALKGEKLGGAVGLGFFSPSATFTPPGSDKVLDTLDMLGQRIGWSAPVRMGSALFDKRVAGQIAPLDQMAALRRSGMIEAAEQAGRKRAVQHAMTVSEIPMTPTASRLLGADSLFSRQGNDFLTRLFENKPNANDLLIKRELPGIEAAVDSWDQLRKSHIQQAKALGMRINQYGDQYGVLYSPRVAREIDFEEYGPQVGRSMYMTSTAEQFSRKKYLITPGGTDDLRFVSTLPIVRQHNKFRGTSTLTDEEVGKVIAAELNKRHGMDAVTDDQGAYIAKMMARINKDLPADYPVFAQHPVAAQAQTIVNQQVAAANANFLYDSLAEAAIRRKNTLVQGGQFKRLDHALNEVAQKVGFVMDRDGKQAAKAVQRNMVDRLRSMGGFTGDIDLAQMSIPENVYNRLMKVHEFYYSPKAQEEVGNLFNKFTSLTKGFLLAWPSRHIRDLYSSAYSVLVETGSVSDTYAGFSAAFKILGGRFDDAVPILRDMPQYRGLADNAAIKRQFMQDAGSTGVLSTLATSDLLTSNIKGDIAQLIPGSTPLTVSGAVRELVPDGSRNPLQQVRDFGAIRNVFNQFETRNPLLNASAQINDLTDSAARLGGFIALMRRGVAPDVAAKRMADALVDYSSLTNIERKVFRNIFPWWAYNSRIGKYVVGELMQRPGGMYGQTIRGMNVLQAADDEHYIPTTLRQQFSIRLPDEWRQRIGMGLGRKENTDTYLTDIDLPGIDTLSTVHPGSMRETLLELANQTHPLIRSTAEYVFDRDLYTGRKLSEATTRADRLYRALSGSKTNLSAGAKTIVENLPGLQRPINFLGGLADERVGFRHALPRELINALSGVKFRDVDENWMIQDMMKKLEPYYERLARDGTYTYIPKELLPDATAMERGAYNMTRQLARRQTELKKQKSKLKQLQGMQSPQ